MLNLSQSTRSALCFFVAALYAALFLLFPMEGVNDRVNYLEMAEVSPLIFARYLGAGVLSVLTNEPVWLGVNSVLGLLLPAENVVQIIIFFSAFTTAYLLLKHNPKAFWFLLFVLFVPQVAKNFIIHIRQGMGIAVFLMAWYSTRPKLRLLLFLMAPMVHSSFFIVLAVLLACYVLKKIRFAFDLRIIAYAAAGIFFGVGLPFVSKLLGARQSETLLSEHEAGGSGVALLVWALLLGFYLMQGRTYLRQHSFSIAMIILYLLVYFVSPVAGRVFESALPLILTSMFYLTSWRRLGAVSLFTMFSVLLMISHLGQPMLGFAEP